MRICEVFLFLFQTEVPTLPKSQHKYPISIQESEENSTSERDSEGLWTLLFTEADQKKGVKLIL